MVTSDTGSREGGWRTSQEAGMTVHWLPVPYDNTMSYPRRVQAFLRFAALSGIKAASLGGDVIFATSTPLTIAIPALLAAKSRRIPMVFEVRDLWPELPRAMGVLTNPALLKAAQTLEKAAYFGSCHVVALSPGMKDGVVATGYPASQVSVIPNSSDFALFDVPAARGRKIRAAHPWLGDRPLVTYIGTLGRLNEVSYLARVAKAMEAVNPEVRFVVIGAGADEKPVREEAARLGVLDRSFFMFKAMPKLDVVSWLSAADVSASLFMDLPAMWANSANKFFDALASGTVPAINYGGWQAQLLKERDAGILLDPKDPAQSARTLASALADRKKLTAMAARARDLGREKFDRDLLFARLEQVLTQAKAGKPFTAQPW